MHKFNEWLSQRELLESPVMRPGRPNPLNAPIPTMPPGGWTREQVNSIESEIARLHQGIGSDFNGKMQQRINDLYKALYQGQGQPQQPQQPQAQQPQQAPQKPQPNFGSYDNPYDASQVNGAFSGWVKTPQGKRYYQNGNLAGGWVDLPPEHRGDTWNGLTTTLFHQGQEQDF